MTKRMILPALLLVFAVLGCSTIKELVAENGPVENSNASNTAVVRETEAPTGAFAPSGDPKADIEKMADRFLSINSFRAKMTTEGKMSMDADLDFIAPDRFRLKTVLPAGGSTKMILIGKQTYMKLGDNWQKMPVDIGSKVPNMRETFTRDGMKWFKEIKFEGEEMVDGKPAYLYSYTGEAPGGGNPYSSKIWIGKADGQPIKITAVYSAGDLKTMAIVYDYDTEITIEPPVVN